MSEGPTRFTSIGNIPLHADEVHVWQASLDADPAAVERFFGYLSPVEKERAARFLSPRDGNRFAVCRGILRELLGGYLRCPASEVRLGAGPRGKPALHSDAGNRTWTYDSMSLIRRESPYTHSRWGARSASTLKRSARKLRLRGSRIDIFLLTNRRNCGICRKSLGQRVFSCAGPAKRLT